MTDNVILHKQLVYISKQLSYSIIFNFIVVLSSSLAMYYVMPDSALPLYWLGIASILSIMRYVLLSFSNKSLDNGNLNDTSQLIIAIAFLGNITWGIGAYLLLPILNTESFILMMVCITSITCSAMPTYAVYYRAYAVFILAATVPLAFILFDIGMYVLGFLTLVYMILMLLCSRPVSQSTLQLLTLDMKNEALLETVTQEKNRADQANISKSRFLAAASHDLRQPLHSMGVFLDVLKKKLLGSEHHSILNHIDKSHQALTDLFDSLLEISRLDSKGMDYQLMNCQLNEIIQPIVVEFEHDTKAKGISLVTDISPQVIVTDPTLFSRVIRNLLSNAIKFTEQGSITISSYLKDESVFLSIKDSGIGIDEEKLTHIFDEYYQINNNARDRSKGVGLGLSVVKKIVDLLGHDIHVASELGKGSRFELTLAKGNIDEAVSLEQQIDFQKLQGNQLKGINVLLVDNEEEILIAMEMLLKEWGVNVFPFVGIDDTEKFLLANQQKIDIIISDYRLDNNDNGVQLIDSARNILGEETAAVIISGDTDTKLRNSIQELGYYILSKPVKAGQLKIILLDLLKGS